MTRMSRAVVMPGDGTWEVRELPVPDPPPGGAVLRVEAVGLCHSDIDHMHGIVHTPWGGAYPSIPGHEIVGRIDALAAGTGERWGVKEGQRVAVRESVPLPGGIRVYGHDYSIDERSGLFGGFADYMELLPETLVEPLPEDVPADELTVWEPLAIAVRWATAVQPGNSVAILGPGHLGLASIVAARAAGAERIFITGTSADALRLDAARGLGVEEAIDVSAADPVERIRELTGDGVDVVIDAASGSTVTVTQGMHMAKRGGTVVIGGLKDRKPVDGFISDWIPMRQLHLHAGFPGDHVKTSIELINQGRVPTAALLGETVTVDGLDDALRAARPRAPRPRRDPAGPADGRVADRSDRLATMAFDTDDTETPTAPSTRTTRTRRPRRPGDYDEFGMLGDNAAEAGLSLTAPPHVTRAAFTVADGQSVSAIAWGDAEPELVLLHGGGQNAHTWDTVALALGRPLLAIDLPGHGHSGRRQDRDYGPWRNAEAVAAVIEQAAPVRPRRRRHVARRLHPHPARGHPPRPGPPGGDRRRDPEQRGPLARPRVGRSRRGRPGQRAAGVRVVRGDGRRGGGREPQPTPVGGRARRPAQRPPAARRALDLALRPVRRAPGGGRRPYRAVGGRARDHRAGHARARRRLAVHRRGGRGRVPAAAPDRPGRGRARSRARHPERPAAAVDPADRGLHLRAADPIAKTGSYVR